jgi:integral membrane sensor domain MASE1
MQVGAEWITSKEGLGGGDDPAWLVIGFAVGDLAGLLLVVSIVLAGIASWKSRERLGRAAGVITTLVLVACLVAVWAMTAKPT